MSLIDFTINTCENNNSINRQIVDNFETHFAMYSFTTIKDMPKIEVSNNDSYIVKGTEKECEEIKNVLSSFKCSHFNDTLVPKFTTIKEGLKIEFVVEGV